MLFALVILVFQCTLYLEAFDTDNKSIRINRKRLFLDASQLLRPIIGQAAIEFTATV